MESKAKNHRLRALNKALLASNGLNVVNRLYKFEQSLKIYLCNHDDLCVAIAKHVSGPSVVPSRDAKAKRAFDKQLFDILRHLHNTVAAAQSLIDHCTVFYRRHYRSQGLLGDYSAEIERRFTTHGLSHFVKGLRQYCQHNKVPVLSSSLPIDRQYAEHSRTVYLPKQELLDFDWKAPARAYIRELSESIDLLHVMTCYREHVVIFYDWLYAELRITHQDDLNDYHRLHDEIESIRDTERHFSTVHTVKRRPSD
jgi:hypothetical protein